MFCCWGGCFAGLGVFGRRVLFRLGFGVGGGGWLWVVSGLTD